MGGSLPDIDNRTPRSTGPCSYEERGGRETLVGGPRHKGGASVGGRSPGVPRLEEMALRRDSPLNRSESGSTRSWNKAHLVNAP